MNCDVGLRQFWFDSVSVFTRWILKRFNLELLALLTQLKRKFTCWRWGIHYVSIQSGLKFIDLWLDIRFSHIIVASILVEIFLRWIFIIIECRQRTKKVNLLVLRYKKFILAISSATWHPALLITTIARRRNIALTIKISNSWCDHHAKRSILSTIKSLRIKVAV